MLASAAFAMGALTGGAITFGGLSLIGAAARRRRGGGGRAAVVAMAAAAGEARGLRIVPQVRRQVPERGGARCRCRSPRAATGCCSASGFTTFILSFAVWALAAVAVALGDPALGVAIGLAFGAGPGAPCGASPRPAPSVAAAAMCERPAILRGLRRVDAAAVALAARCRWRRPATAPRHRGAPCPPVRHTPAVRSSVAHARSPRSPAPPTTPPPPAAARWQRPSGVALLARDGGAVGLPGRNPAWSRRAAWPARSTAASLADPATLAPVAIHDAPDADVFAVSDAWLAWRARGAGGGRRAVGPRWPPRGGGARGGGPAARGAGPPRAGREPAPLSTRPGPRAAASALDLGAATAPCCAASRARCSPTRRPTAPRLLYVRATGLTQELRVGLLRPRSTERDPAVLIAPSPGQRDAEHGPARRHRPQIPLPPLAERGVDDTLWTTALTATHAYVTRLRTSRDGPRTADIMRVRVLVGEARAQ